jgi:hypothetical protein
MSDCPNADIRDLLPDLLHDRLDAGTRARVVAHIDDCADCRSELELLRFARSSLDRDTPRVEVNRIVAALPTPSSVRPLQRRRGWRVLNDWRIAAAVTFIVAGGTSVVVMHNVRDGGSDSANVTAVRHVGGAASESTVNTSPSIPGNGVRSPAPNATTAAVPTQPRSVKTPAPAGQGNAESLATTDEQTPVANNRIGDLNERQLKSLLNAIEHMDATPITEPEPVTLRVGAKTSSPTGL